MSTVRFLDLARLHQTIAEDIEGAIRAVLASGAFVGGPEVAEFERAFGALHGLPPGAACGSGTDALFLALAALRLERGDEVVVPALTFVATAEAVVHAGGVPVVADVNPTTLLLDPVCVTAARTERTRAVVPVHLFGHVVPFEHIDAWREEGLLVVEDAAQAHLATWRERCVGSASDASCFSFYPGKNLGAVGDGGIVLSPEVTVIDQIRRAREHGSPAKHVHDEIGWCSRLDTVQAAVLLVKLAHLPTWTDARRAIAAEYRERVGDMLVPWEEGAVHHLLVVRVPADRRDAVREHLGERGIETGLHYPRALTEHAAMRPWLRSPCPAAERAASEVISLPMDPLMTIAEVERVTDALRAALG